MNSPKIQNLVSVNWHQHNIARICIFLKDFLYRKNLQFFIKNPDAAFCRDCLSRPEKYLAIHFANNIWKSNTAEIMGHDGTAQDAYEAVANFASEIKMIPLRLHKEQPGYILNSMLIPFLSAGEMLLAKEVADPATIDLTWRLGTGSPLGPFQILDIVGLNTALNIVSNNPQSQDPESIPGKIKAILEKYVAEGKIGVNAGEGFYKYK